jgi:hypothetical protein
MEIVIKKTKDRKRLKYWKLKRIPPGGNQTISLMTISR